MRLKRICLWGGEVNLENFQDKITMSTHLEVSLVKKTKPYYCLKCVKIRRKKIKSCVAVCLKQRMVKSCITFKKIFTQQVSNLTQFRRFVVRIFSCKLYLTIEVMWKAYFQDVVLLWFLSCLWKCNILIAW